MELVLEVNEINVKNHLYHRLLVPKRVSTSLGLQKGDKLRIDIKGLMRQGKLILGDPPNDEDA